VLQVVLATILTSTPITSAQASPSQLAFAGGRSSGLHGCDPTVPPPDDSFVFCVSAAAPNRTPRAYGDMIKTCLTSGLIHRTNGPPLDPKTELSFLVTRGTVADLACELGVLLEIVVTAQPNVAPLALGHVHWYGLLAEASDHPLRAENGTVVILQVDYEKNTITLGTNASTEPKR